MTNYAARHDLPYKLCLVEYAMPGCYMMLHTLLDEVPRLDGVILFSMFMLPIERANRENVYACFIRHGAELHAALEGVAIRSWADVASFEDTIQVARALRGAPLHGRFDKTGASYSLSDSFVAAVLATTGQR